MFSRRSFLLATFGLTLSPMAALAKKKPAGLPRGGPHTLAREEWPPAIQPDYLTVVDKGNALISDQSGRLAIVNFKREEGPLVVGELVGIGKKTIDLATTPGRAYAIAYQEINGESQHSLVVINILPNGDPVIAARVPLGYFSEPMAVAAGSDLYAIGGASLGGQNQVLLYPSNSKRPVSDSATPATTLAFDSSIVRLDYQEKQLCVLLSSGNVTQLEVFNLSNLQNPLKTASIRFDGHYDVFARNRDMAVIAGQGNDRRFDVRIIAMKPNAHVVSRLAVPVSEILDVALQKGQLLLLANQTNRLVVMPITYGGKNMDMTALQAVLLPAGTGGTASKARIAASGKDAYVAADSGGVQVLNINKGGWQYTYSHTIPRLPAAAISVSNDRAVLGGADLKIYNISQPQHPTLIEAVELGSAVKALRVLGNQILALTRDSLSLRAIDKPSNTVASVKVSGQGMAYDRAQQCAYVLAPKQKTTTIFPVRVATNLTAEKAMEIDGAYQRGAAEGGKMLLCGLNTMALYNLLDTPQLIAARQFPNLAIRDVALVGTTAVITAIDSSSRGFLLVINAGSPELNTIGSVDLPQDGVALAVSGRNAVVVGRANGKDMASIVDVNNPSAPRVLESFPVLDHASAVVIRDRLAIVAGRGLEILNL